MAHAACSIPKWISCLLVHQKIPRAIVRQRIGVSSQLCRARRSAERRLQTVVRGSDGLNFSISAPQVGTDELSITVSFNAFREEVLREIIFVNERSGPVIPQVRDIFRGWRGSRWKPLQVDVI